MKANQQEPHFLKGLSFSKIRTRTIFCEKPRIFTGFSEKSLVKSKNETIVVLKFQKVVLLHWKKWNSLPTSLKLLHLKKILDDGGLLIRTQWL